MDIRFSGAARLGLGLVIGLSIVSVSNATNWARFRGPNGSGVSSDSASVPARWSESENLKWKLALPGPGLSSPIVIGDRVFLTCYTGYGLDERNPGNQEDLRRHLLCIDRKNGKTLWSKAVDPVLPEDPYRGQFTQHGYASHTPVSDGKRVYVFFGKTGALAFDLDGNKLWQKSLGTESGIRGWGTASSPIVYKNLLIVPAFAESEALVALNTETGEEVWKQEANGFSGTWGSPILVDVGDGRQDLVIGVAYEIWGINPDTGKLRWYCESPQSESMCASVISHDGIVYAIGGRSGGSIAVRAGGKGDVSKTHVVWSGRDQARITTPVYYKGKIYWISRGVANCIEAKDGERVYQARLGGSTASAGGNENSDRGADRPGGFGGGGFRGGGGRGRGGPGGGQDYSSPVVGDGKLYFVSRSGDVHVVALGSEFQQVAKNRFESDNGEFSSTPAVSDGELFIRSSNYLYCVKESK